MPQCQECKNFFPLKEEEGVGDCVTRVIDPRQAYWRAKPVASDEDAAKCGSFQKADKANVPIS